MYWIYRQGGLLTSQCFLRKIESWDQNWVFTLSGIRVQGCRGRETVHWLTCDLYPCMRSEEQLFAKYQTKFLNFFFCYSSPSSRQPCISKMSSVILQEFLLKISEVYCEYFCLYTVHGFLLAPAQNLLDSSAGLARKTLTVLLGWRLEKEKAWLAIICSDQI